MTAFLLSSAVTEKFPSLHVGLLIVRGTSNIVSSPDISALLRAEEASIRAKYSDPEQLKTDPFIAAWQDAHRAFGSNPNKFPSSIHALLKRVTKGGELPGINPLVDLYNAISLRHIAPAGGEDLDACCGDIVLALADGTESFVALGETESDPPLRGEVIYRDDEGVLCRRFNWREAARTCLTNDTKDAVLVIEAISPMTRADLETALEELSVLVRRHCGGEVRAVILDGVKPRCDLQP